MGKAVAEAAVSAGLQLIPASFSGPAESGQVIHVGSTEVHLHGPYEKEDVLSSVLDKHPDAIVVDFTVPDAVNPNAELYCKIGVPFVMGTTGVDMEKLYKTVEDSNVYAVISPQMGKQVVAFLAAMEIMANQFPGAFSGYSLQVMESHQASKLDTSGTAKAIISCFKKLGVSFELDQIQQIRDPKRQLEVVGVPEEYLSGHAFHLYHLTSPDKTVSFEFQYNVCGRSIYAEGSIDAAIFLYKKVAQACFNLKLIEPRQTDVHVSNGDQEKAKTHEHKIDIGDEKSDFLETNGCYMLSTSLYFECMDHHFHLCICWLRCFQQPCWDLLLPTGIISQIFVACYFLQHYQIIGERSIRS